MGPDIEANTERVRHHIRRPDAGRREQLKMIMETATYTIWLTVPGVPPADYGLGLKRWGACRVRLVSSGICLMWSRSTGHLSPASSVFGFLAEHRHQLLPADTFADLFPSSRGRPIDPGGVDRFGDRVAGLARFL